MKSLSDFLRNLSAQGAIIGAFCVCIAAITGALAVCMIFHIKPDPDVLANSKELFIALSSALIGYLIPRGQRDVPPPGGKATTETVTTTKMETPASSELAPK